VQLTPAPILAITEVDAVALGSLGFIRRGAIEKPRSARLMIRAMPTEWQFYRFPRPKRPRAIGSVARSCACAELLHSLGELLGPGLKRVIDISPIVPLFSELPDDQKRKVPAMIGPLIWTLKPNLPSLPVILKLRLR